MVERRTVDGVWKNSPPEEKEPKREKFCDLCDGEFMPRRRVDRFCSSECRKKWYKTRRIAKGPGREARISRCIQENLTSRGWVSVSEWKIPNDRGRMPLRADLAIWAPDRDPETLSPSFVIEVKYNNGWIAIAQAIRYSALSGVPAIVATAVDDWEYVAEFMRRAGLGYWRVDLEAGTVTRLV